MAKIPRSYLDALTTALNTLSEGAQIVAAQQLASLEYTDIADLREKVIDILEPLLAHSAEVAAASAAVAYDAMREEAVGSAYGAVAHSGRVPEATAGAVKGLVDIVDKGKPWEMFVNEVLDRCDYEVKCAAGESVAYNSEHDKKSDGYARVPQGSETCGFCLMLASFGYKHGDKDKVKHAHPNCYCRIVPCFEGADIEGYDPNGMYDRFNQCLDALGGHDGIRKDWDAMPDADRKDYIERHGGKAGKAYQDYVNKRLAAEIETRDADWFRGKIEKCEVKYAPEWNKAERDTADLLGTLGFYVDPIERSSKRTPDFNLNDIDWEMKCPDLYGEWTVWNAFKSDVIKKGKINIQSERLLISNYGNDASFDQMCADIQKIIDDDKWIEVTEVMAVDKSGRMRRWKR